MVDGMWNYLEYISQKWPVPMKRNDIHTWKEFSHLHPKHNMLMQHFQIGHAQYLWDIRQNSKVAEVFGVIHNSPIHELLVSFDSAAVQFPPEITGLRHYQKEHEYHCDQIDSGERCVQRWITANEVQRGDATLAFYEGSHQYHAELKEKPYI
jgi:hypothetical protein